MAFDNSVSDIINIRSFINDWSNLLSDTGTQSSYNDLHSHVQTEMGISKEMAIELASVCSVDALLCDGEADTVGFLSSVPDNLPLETTRFQKAELEKRAQSSTYRLKVLSKMKYQRQNAPWLPQEKKSKLTDDISSQSYDAIVTVQIFRPYYKKTTHSQPQLSEEFEVLGSQRLTCLRDAIHCDADTVIPGNHSQHPDEILEMTKELYKSASFCIENVFYNDLRHPECIDYSREIMEWANEKRRRLGPYTTADMNETCFSELSLRLGQPYVYLHQGDCEHLVVFSEIRLTHECPAKNYPLLISNHKEKRMNYCRVCFRFRPRWLTYGSPLAPEDPCFFCDTCFRMLHYDTSGNLLFEFRAHPINADAKPNELKFVKK